MLSLTLIAMRGSSSADPATRNPSDTVATSPSATVRRSGAHATAPHDHLTPTRNQPVRSVSTRLTVASTSLTDARPVR